MSRGIKMCLNSNKIEHILYCCIGFHIYRNLKFFQYTMGESFKPHLMDWKWENNQKLVILGMRYK